MVWAITIVLVLLWGLAVGSSYAFGGYIHVLIVTAMVLAAYRVFLHYRDRRMPARVVERGGSRGKSR